MAGKGRLGQGRLGQGRAGQVRAGQFRAGQVRAGQVRSGQARSGTVRSGQVRSTAGTHGVCPFDVLNGRFNLQVSRLRSMNSAAQVHTLPTPKNWVALARYR